MSLSDNDAVRGEWVREMQLNGAQPCPVCRHAPQLRRHVFTTTMALALIHLYRRVAVNEGTAIDPATMPEVVKTGDSLRKLELWGLASRDEAGYFLTEQGLEAVEKRRTVASHCVAAHGEGLWFTGELKWIDETLNQRYSYEDLMKGPA